MNLQMSVFECITVGSAMITLVGFGVTLWQLRQTKTAAESASLSSRQTASRINSIMTISDLSKYIQLMKLIVENVYDKKFMNAAEKLSEVRDIVIEIKNNPRIDTTLKPVEIDNLITSLNSDIYNLRQLSSGQTITIEFRDLEARINTVHMLLKDIESKIKTRYAS